MRRGAPSRWALLTAMSLIAFGMLGFPRSGSAHSHEPSPTLAPRDVWVGMFVNQIYELSLKENFFVANLYLWFRWKDGPWEDGTPFEPDKTFGIIEGRIESNDEVARKELPDGFHYACRRITAKITKFWDVTKYPMDHHTLTIGIEEEDKETHLVRYLADDAPSGVSPDIRMPGWQLAKLGTAASEGSYASNFGDATLPTGNESRYSRFTYRMEFRRHGTGYLFKIFFGVWIAALIAFLCFFIKPTNVDPRFGLAVGALFAAIASEYIVTSTLPDTNLLTLADKVHIVGFAAIFVVVLQSTISLWWMENDRQAASKRFDRLFGYGLPILYMAVNAFLVLTR